MFDCFEKKILAVLLKCAIVLIKKYHRFHQKVLSFSSKGSIVFYEKSLFFG